MRNLYFGTASPLTLPSERPDVHGHLEVSLRSAAGQAKPSAGQAFAEQHARALNERFASAAEQLDSDKLG